MKPQSIPRYKTIKIVNGVERIPYKKPCFQLINDKKLLAALKKIKKNILCCENELDGCYNIKAIEKIFNCSIIFKRYSRKNKLRGYCFTKKRIIIIYLSRIAKKNKETITHELGHLIQEDTKTSIEHFREFYPRLSKVLRFEQQAETLSYFLFKIIYPEKKLNINNFSRSYFNEQDIKWLSTYYPHCKNDLYVERKKRRKIA